MLTDEYFYIEEIPQPVKEVDAEIVETYSEGLCMKRNESEYSVAKKRSQDFRLHEIEQQLHTAEKRCNTLKGQLDYMKMLYQGTAPKLRKTPRQQLIANSPRKSHHRSRLTNVIDRDGKGDKFQDLPTREEPNLSPKHRPGVVNVPTLVLHQDDELPVKDTDNQMAIGDRRRRASPLPLTLPPPSSRFSVNPEQTINSILTGITNSVNRISLLNDHISDDIKSSVTLNKKIPHKKNPRLHNPSLTKSGVQFISMVPKKLASKNSIAGYDRKKYMKRTLSETYIKKSPKLLLSDNIRKITAARNSMKKSLKGPNSSSETLRQMKKQSKSAIQPKESLHKNKMQRRDPSVDNRNKTFSKDVPKKFDDSVSVKSKSLRKHRVSTSSILKKVTKKKVKLPNQLTEEQGFETKIRDWQADNLVELYHNEAAKSDTESEDRRIGHRGLRNKLKREIKDVFETKNLMNEHSLNYGKEIARHTKNMQPVRLQNIPVIENISQENDSPRRALSPIAETIPGSVTISKIATNTNANRFRSKSLQRSGIITSDGIFNGYELPTISSRLKQVAKSYYQKYVYHSIPFVPTRSTTPSHNLGLNIQQALSIFKHRQPSINGLSPTLAINMGLSAGEGHGMSRPVSALLSRLGSHVTYNRRASSVKQSQQIGSGCPLLRHVGSNSGGLDESADQSPLISPRIGASLPIQNVKVSEVDDRDLRERMLTEWDQASPRHKQGERCTCLPRHYVDQNKMLNKYVPEQHMRESGDQLPKQQNGTVRLPSMHNMRNTNTKNEQSQKKDEILTEKIKGLRQVLVQLHEDFTNLNEKYEKLQELVKENQMDDVEASKELEKIEKDLKTKEEEISIVVGLYKEVLALKEQVKILRERTSQISIVPSVFNPSRRSSLMSRSPYRHEPTATLRLTKLLRQVQNFQEQLRMS